MTLVLVVLLALVLVAAYGAAVLARRWRVPAALLLMALGLLAAGLYPNVYAGPVRQGLEVLGTLGLILIVLEGALDLRLTRARLPLIRRAAGVAVAVTVLTSGLIALGLHLWAGAPVKGALLAGVAFGIVSSAILIPSVTHLADEQREFLTYESVISDILGILLFSIVLEAEALNLQLVWGLLGKLVATLLLSGAGAVLLTYLLDWVAGRHRFTLIVALMVLVYAAGKWLHLPTLMAVLFFGLLINNLDRLREALPALRLPTLPHADVEELRMLNEEGAFVIRSFFFVLLGYSIEPAGLVEAQALAVAGGLLLAIYAARGLVVALSRQPGGGRVALLAPRGLVSIILYVSIPPALAPAAVGPAVLGLVVLATAVVMLLGLMGEGRGGRP